jgi:hypothetical protein
MFHLDLSCFWILDPKTTPNHTQQTFQKNSGAVCDVGQKHKKQKHGNRNRNGKWFYGTFPVNNYRLITPILRFHQGPISQLEVRVRNRTIFERFKSWSYEGGITDSTVYYVSSAGHNYGSLCWTSTFVPPFRRFAAISGFWTQWTQVSKSVSGQIRK